MPRSLLLSGSRLTVLWDANGSISEMYNPGPGDSNHLQDGGIRFGVRFDGSTEWLDSPTWDRTCEFDPETERASWVFRNGDREVSCTASVVVDRLNLEWTSGAASRLFVYSKFHIGETEIGGTAAYLEPVGEMLHYAGPTGFAIRGSIRHTIVDYACGIVDFLGAEGTWRDAEDGVLEKNPIAQGSVDSTCAFDLPSGELVEIQIQAISRPLAPEPYYLRQAESLEVPAAWRPTEIDAIEDARIRRLCQSSLYILRSHLHQGAIPLASLDRAVMSTNRAHYSHCWTRDATVIVECLLDWGDPKPALGLAEFASTLISGKAPYFLQKYDAYGNLASTWHPWREGIPAVQSDETAAVVRLASRLVEERLGESQFLLEALIVPCADWLAAFVEPSGLPSPSWDLWEERRSTTAFTTGRTIDALRAASRAASTALPDRSARWNSAADTMSKAFNELLIDADGGFVQRSVDDPFTVDSSVLEAAHLAGVGDSAIRATLEQVGRLRVRNGIDGFARYENDYYFRRYDDGPGNPWAICTLWVAQCEIRLARTGQDLDSAERWIEWCADRFVSDQLLGEQFDAKTGEPLAVSPLAWSHAEFLRTVQLLRAGRARVQSPFEPT